MGVQEILMEGIRQLDELNRIHDELPDLHARLELAFPMGPPLRALAPSDLDILQIAHNATDVEAVMNKSALTDFETVQAVLKLLKANYLKLAEASR